ncbi:MAG: ATP-dependent helicase [Gammaproteobacteria bacterium]|nr:ATP-dependent helicase [Gammaproteobacteria bacterium]
MAARRFALPDIQDLSKEQERARLLPKEGCHLIVGGPGTGKSVIALLRARRHHRTADKRQAGSQDYVFLAYNKLLIAASRELMGGQVHAQTWISWFKSAYQSALRDYCPTRDAQAFDLDWQAIIQGIRTAGELAAPIPRHLVIDEGQDMPRAFYHALAELGFAHFFVVADQNQQITDQHSTVKDIADALDLDASERLVLRENYRNSYAVGRLALSFCVHDPASPCAQLPAPGGSAQTPLLIDYGAGCPWGFDELILRLLKAADRDPSRLFGLITPDNETRRRWLSVLRGTQVQLDHGPPRIVTYASGEDHGDLRFSEGGIFVINAQSAKGLEFDSVILADINRYHCNPEDKTQMDDMRRRFYVMVSRARERVTLLRETGLPCPVNAILPTDPDVLVPWTQS